MAINAKLIILLFSALTITQLSCVNPCKGIDPINHTIIIELVNSQGDDLIDSIYTEDRYEIIESTSNRTIIAPRRDKTKSATGKAYLAFGFQEKLQDTDYYINWDSNDTDTISFRWNTTYLECGTSYEVIETKHNNSEIDFEIKYGDSIITLIQ